MATRLSTARSVARPERPAFVWPGPENRPDAPLIAAIVGLALFGTVMIYSASGVYAMQKYGSPYYFLWRQLKWLVIGIGGMLLAMSFDYTRLRNPRLLGSALVGCIGLLLLVFIFPPVKGAHRWIASHGISIQPSELVKLVVVVYLAYFLDRRIASGEVDSFKRTFWPSCLLVAIMAGLVLPEPDLGTALLLGVSLPVMHFGAGVRLRYHAVATVLLLPLAYYELTHVAFRAGRLKAFFDPFAYQSKEGFQTVQSLLAVGSGGMWGLGFAAGRQKLLFLPEAHTDFIFSIIAEELGLIGALALLIVFALLLWRGLRAGLRAPDGFGRLLAIGLTMSIVIQALFNISVTINLLPAKGLPLPFISYGGSSLIFTLLGAGLLLSVSGAAEKQFRVAGQAEWN